MYRTKYDTCIDINKPSSTPHTLDHWNRWRGEGWSVLKSTLKFLNNMFDNLNFKYVHTLIKWKKKHINLNILRRVRDTTERLKIDASNVCDTAVVTILKRFKKFKLAKINVKIH